MNPTNRYVTFGPLPAHLTAADLASRRRRPPRRLAALVVAAAALSAGSARAAGGDFSNIDFAAAAPFTYDHATGGGAYNDRTVGKHDDVTEQLEGGEFACGDIVNSVNYFGRSTTTILSGRGSQVEGSVQRPCTEPDRGLQGSRGRDHCLVSGVGAGGSAAAAALGVR